MHLSHNFRFFNRTTKPFSCLLVLTLLGLLISSNVSAETRKECERRVYDQTTVAAGAAGGGITGTVAGTAACSGFLGLVLFDFGVSYGTCVALAIGTGTVAGTFVGEAISKEELRKCERLP